MWNKSFAACLNMNLGEMECANEGELNYLKDNSVVNLTSYLCAVFDLADLYLAWDVKTVNEIATKYQRVFWSKNRMDPPCTTRITNKMVIHDMQNTGFTLQCITYSLVHSPLAHLP